MPSLIELLGSRGDRDPDDAVGLAILRDIGQQLHRNAVSKFR